MTPNGNGNGNGWTQIVLRQGVATAIALFLVWMLAGSFGADLKEVRADLRQHMSETRFYMWAICMNVAQDDAGRQRCVR